MLHHPLLVVEAGAAAEARGAVAVDAKAIGDALSAGMHGQGAELTGGAAIVWGVRIPRALLKKMAAAWDDGLQHAAA